MKHNDCIWTSSAIDNSQTSCLRSRCLLLNHRCTFKPPFVFDKRFFSVLVPFAQEFGAQLQNAAAAVVAGDDANNACRSKLHERLGLLAAFAIRRRCYTLPLLTSHSQSVLIYGSFGGMEGDMQMLSSLSRLYSQPSSNECFITCLLSRLFKALESQIAKRCLRSII